MGIVVAPRKLPALRHRRPSAACLAWWLTSERRTHLRRRRRQRLEHSRRSLPTCCRKEDAFSMTMSSRSCSPTAPTRLATSASSRTGKHRDPPTHQLISPARWISRQPWPTQVSQTQSRSLVPKTRQLSAQSSKFPRPNTPSLWKTRPSASPSPAPQNAALIAGRTRQLEDDELRPPPLRRPPHRYGRVLHRTRCLPCRGRGPDRAAIRPRRRARNPARGGACRSARGVERAAHRPPGCIGLASTRPVAAAPSAHHGGGKRPFRCACGDGP